MRPALTILTPWVLAAPIALLLTTATGADGPTFYADDPLPRIVDSQDASGVRPRQIDLVYDTLENLFHRPGDPTLDVRAQNVNTIDEVPDSSWFTNRLGVTPLSVEDVVKGPGTGAGPAPDGWIVLSAKTDGVMPGFTVRDGAGDVWFLKFDPPGHPGMATGTEAVVARLFWALGYNVPDTQLATLRPNELGIDPDARITPPSGRRRAFVRADVDRLLRRAHRNVDGTYRVLASRALPGRVVGPFRFYGVRSDDPNDVVPHEHRRELRAYGTFAAWVNHVDSKSINTMDTVIEQDGRSVVRHHLLDFGSTIGSAGVYPREPFEGTEYLVEGGPTLAGMLSFGLYIKPWRTVPLYRSRSVGALPLDMRTWDPEGWKARYPNSAFRAARLDDKFWAARRLDAFSDDMLAAVVRVGAIGDPRSEEVLTAFLIGRRDAIVRRYLPAVNPVVELRLSPSGTFTFRNAAVDADAAPAPPEYTVVWSLFDNATGAATPLGTTRTSTLRVDAPQDLPARDGTYVRLEISTGGGPQPRTIPARAFFRRDAAEWRLIGFQRLPGGNPPTTTSATGARPRRAARR
jgi:hypothetical protein